MPRLPKTINGPRGPIRVERARVVLDDDGNHCDGIFDAERRAIVIRAGLRLPAAWATFRHEVGEAWLHDGAFAVLHRLDEDVREAVVEAIALGLHHFQKE